MVGYNQNTQFAVPPRKWPPMNGSPPPHAPLPFGMQLVGAAPPPSAPRTPEPADPRPRPWTTDVVRLLRKWARRIHARERAHAEYADQYSTLRSIMGVPTAMFTGTSSVGGFLTYRNCEGEGGGEAANTPECDREESLRLTLAVLSTGALITSQLQTFYNFGKLSDRHKTAADNYSALYHKIEAELEKPPTHRNDPLDVLHDVRTRYDKAQRDAPRLRREPSSEETGGEGEGRGGVERGGGGTRGCGADLIVLEDGGTLSSFLHQMRVAPRTNPETGRGAGVGAGAGMRVQDLESGVWSIPFEEVLAELDNITPGFVLPTQPSFSHSHSHSHHRRSTQPTTGTASGTASGSASGSASGLEDAHAASDGSE